MKKLTLITISIISLAVLATSFMACAANVPSSPQPTVTVKATETVTATPAPITVTAPAPAPVTVTVTPTPSPTITISPTGVPEAYPVEKYNNPSFLVGQDIIGYNKTPQSDGTIKQTPIYQDVFLNLGKWGFLTKKDATFVPHIPTISARDDWFARFQIGGVKIPFAINWGYMIKPNKPDTYLTYGLWKDDYFKNTYYNSPNLLDGRSLGNDSYVSAEGIHLQFVGQEGNFVVLLRTNNPDDILGWWFKYGGEPLK